jgi:hypothetical protein
MMDVVRGAEAQKKEKREGLHLRCSRDRDQ